MEFEIFGIHVHFCGGELEMLAASYELIVVNIQRAALAFQQGSAKLAAHIVRTFSVLRLP